MASYPTSVKAFTTKNDGSGNTIFAAHVNDLQDEVTAIEDGLLNGTAPLHSSNTIVNNLTVSGGSTVAGVLNVAGASSFAGAVAITGAFQSSNSTVNNLSVASKSTFAGDAVFNSSVTIAGELYVTKPPPYVRAAHSAKTDIANNAVTALSFDTHRHISTSVMHSTTTTPSRFFAPSSGFYLMSGHIFWNTLSTAGAGAISGMDIRLNGATDLAWQARSVAPTGTDGRMSVTTAYKLSTSDYVELCVYQNTGSTASIQSLANSSPEFSLVKIR